VVKRRGLLTACLLAAAPAGARKKLLAEPGTRLPDCLLPTNFGDILFHDLSLAKSPRKSTLLSGSVTNLTDKRWIRLAADLELLGDGGEILAGAPLVYTNLLPGHTGHIVGGAEGQPFPQAEYCGVRVLYRAGEVDAIYVLTMLKPEPNRLLVYEDEDAVYSFTVSDGCIDLKLRNKSPYVLKIDWSRASLVDVLERSHEITHHAKLPGKVRPYDLLSESLSPVQLQGEPAPQILPRTQDMESMKGKIISLSLGIDLDGQKKDHLFVFQVAAILYGAS
jgi:hypothetical protein